MLYPFDPSQSFARDESSPEQVRGSAAAHTPAWSMAASRSSASHLATEMWGTDMTQTITIREGPPQSIAERDIVPLMNKGRYTFVVDTPTR
jgi:hypothetical protein